MKKQQTIEEVYQDNVHELPEAMRSAYREGLKDMYNFLVPECDDSQQAFVCMSVERCAPQRGFCSKCEAPIPR